MTLAAVGGIERKALLQVVRGAGRRSRRREVGVPVETLDLGEIETARRGWPFFRDRRIDAYAGLTERFIDPD